jgi:hypothetical protein
MRINLVRAGLLTVSLISLVLSAQVYYIEEASGRELLRLRKSYLLELYSMAGLVDDVASLTKQEIVDTIIASRDEDGPATLPPSSPRDRDDNSSEYSSDDGDMLPNEEDTVSYRHSVASPLRRRITVHDVGHVSPRPAKERMLTSDQLEQPATPYRKTARNTASVVLFPKTR